jgi:hypothetical protein
MKKVNYIKLQSIPETPQLAEQFMIKIVSGSGDEMACQVDTQDTFGTLKTKIEQRWRTPAVLQQLFVGEGVVFFGRNLFPVHIL